MPGEAHLWALPKVDLPTNFWNRQHEVDCGDLFVSYFNSAGPKRLTHWDAYWDEEEKKGKRVFYDRRMVLDDKVLLVEVDRGTEELDRFEDKIRKYISYSASHPDDWFYVLITVQGYRSTAELRIQHILDILKRKNVHAFQYLVAPHEAVLADPLGKVWAIWKDPTPHLSLSDLRA